MDPDDPGHVLAEIGTPSPPNEQASPFPVPPRLSLSRQLQASSPRVSHCVTGFLDTNGAKTRKDDCSPVINIVGPSPGHARPDIPFPRS